MPSNVPVAIITGASRGIGRAAAIAFARRGYAVGFCARSLDALAETRQKVEEVGGTAFLKQVDVANGQAIRQFIADALEEFGRVDVLVNNAGVAPMAPIDEISIEEFELATAVNTGAVFHAVQAVWPAMKQQKEGTILSISSLASIDPFPGFQVYGATKAWVNLFTKSIADEGKSLGIRAFALALGTVETTMLRGLFPDFPAKDTLAPEEVAEFLATLAQPACRYASGSTIPFHK